MKDTSLGRIAGVLVSPAKTFQAIAERPTWLVAMLVHVVVGAVFWLLAAPKIDWEATLTTKLIRAGREAELGKLETVLPFLEENGTALLVGVTLLLPWILNPLLALICGGVLKWVGGYTPFRTNLAVVLYSLMPATVASVFISPLLFMSGSINLYDPGRLVPNLTAFAGPETSLALWTLLTNISAFTLWTLALLVIGFGIAAKITRLRAAICVVGLWVLWVAFLVGLAAAE